MARWGAWGQVDCIFDVIVIIAVVGLNIFYFCILCTYNKHIKRIYNTMLVYKWDSE